jgi:hypothetical protein
MTGLAGAGAVFAYFLYRPLFRPPAPCRFPSDLSGNPGTRYGGDRESPCAR